MTRVFGHYCERLPDSPEFLIIGFSPGSIPLRQRWRNNGLSADFMADYLMTFFPDDESEESSAQRQAEIKSAVSYIANELLENAMKFNDANSNLPIGIELQLHEGSLTFVTRNTISREVVSEFERYIERLTSCDPQELYIEQIEKSALGDGNGSGLGYLTMMNDYAAQLGWKFESIEGDEGLVAISTMVRLPV
ncbi:MAG: DUF6272 family protein [Geitlerinemataceae cyanobacterium]